MDTIFKIIFSICSLSVAMSTDAQTRPVVAGERASPATTIYARQTGVIASSEQPRHPEYQSRRPIVAGERNNMPKPIIQRQLIIERRPAIPAITLFPRIISPKGNMIELSDGSIWKIKRSDRHRARKWSIRDTICVKVDSYLFWNSVSLINCHRGESVEVVAF